MPYDETRECPDHFGYSVIDTEYRCAIAAAHLGKPYRGSKNSATSTKGCYLTKGEVYCNIHPTGRGHSRFDGWSIFPICSKAKTNCEDSDKCLQASPGFDNSDTCASTWRHIGDTWRALCCPTTCGVE